MALRRSIFIVLAALLAACGTAPRQPATFVPSSPATARPSPTPAATQALLPTAPAAATVTLPQPTAAPTQAAAPTEVTAPTQASPPTQAPAPTNAPAPTSVAGVPIGSELLFMRQGTLVAFDIATGKERALARSLYEFAAAPDGKSLAVVLVGQPETDLWVMRRDGGGLRQITTNGNQRVEAVMAWSPDGTAIAYASSDSSDPYARTWMEWSAWCSASEVHVFDLATGADRSFGAGCDPVFSPDGKRIAYATPPSTRQEGSNSPNATNTIRLINRQGQNGWSFAAASGSADIGSPKRGLLVYAPAFSPDGKQLTYQRFLGYQALVDLDLTEIGGSFEGKGQPLDAGAGWLLPARFSPDGQRVAIVENNFSDARGFGGYDNWSVRVLQLGGTHDIAMPTGSIKAVGQAVAALPRAQAASWSPDGASLAVLLPPGWKPGLPPDQPFGADGQSGAIWSWKPGADPAKKLVDKVDFASPVQWLPAVP